jgi:hypothetical protein
VILSLQIVPSPAFCRCCRIKPFSRTLASPTNTQGSWNMVGEGVVRPLSASHIALRIPAVEVSFNWSVSSRQVVPLKLTIFFGYLYNNDYVLMFIIGKYGNDLKNILTESSKWFS